MNAGVLSIANPNLAPGADVYLATGATLNLNFNATNEIDSLFVNGVSKETGTWGGSGSGADHISDLLTGMGRLLVKTFIAPTILIGDYNNNGVVDAADYTVWRDHLGGDGALLGANRDPLNMGNVSTADYNSWKSHFGATLMGAGSLATQQSVPEPTSLALAISDAIAAGRRSSVLAVVESGLSLCLGCSSVNFNLEVD